MLILGLTLAAALVVYNTVTNRRWPGDRWYTPRNVLVGAALVVVARAAGLSWAELGLGPGAWAAGIRWGRGIVLVVLIGLAVGAALAPRVPAIARLLSDRRADVEPRELAWQTLVRIPIGTAAFEELAFRGVVLGLLLQATGEVWAVAISSVAFGLWHIGPTLAALEENRVSGDPTRAVAGAIVATTVGGVLFAVLRLAASLVAVVIAHWATNAIGLLAAAAYQRTEADQ